jgi:hypothetical protein
MSTHGGKNPSVRQYLMDASTNLPKNVNVYIYDLEAKNNDYAMPWDADAPRSYQTGLFGMPTDLSPSSIKSMADQLF